MFEVTVESGFSSGHYLRNYKGKCENPHGHNYKVRVTLAGAELDHAGLLLDFKLLKQVLRPVVERIDHQMLNDLEPFTVLNPSAENIAKYFYDQTNEQLAATTEGYLRHGLERITGGNPAKWLVIYCRPLCWMSWNAAKRALMMGYRNVAWYPDGDEGWEAAGLPLQEAKPAPADGD